MGKRTDPLFPAYIHAMALVCFPVGYLIGLASPKVESALGYVGTGLAFSAGIYIFVLVAGLLAVAPDLVAAIIRKLSGK